MKRKYAVVDLETTGGIPKRDRITEVAIIIFDGERIIDEFQTLINPERSIPPNITRITGITNEMVAEAPRFYEVAKKIVEMTEGAVFVAHNVRFDYQFLREEFKSLGFTFTKRNLCTVKLSRKTFPGLRSYALGNLIRYFDIEVANRHRAYDDAWATTILLEKIFEQQKTKKDRNKLVTESIKLTGLPPSLTIADIESLPDECGVYYFEDKDGQIIYVGKSINIRKRVKQHFSKHTRKANKLLQKVTRVSYELTGSELLSLLKESREIKQLQPVINRTQKTRFYSYAVTQQLDKSGYARYVIQKSEKADSALSYYGSRKSAQNHIKQITDAFNLCPKINGLEKATTSCFAHSVSKCYGACIGSEFPYDYNQRFEDSLHLMNRHFEDNFLIAEHGRNPREKVVFLVEDGHYRGYSRIETDTTSYQLEELRDNIKPEKLNPEADLIVRNYIWSKVNLQIKYF